MRPFKMVVSPDPVLRQVCEPCVVGDKSLKKIAERMAATMYKNYGCGIAAPQVGISKRLVVIDCGDPETEDPDPMFLVNPEIIELKGEPEVGMEGCLSLPGIQVPVTRHPIAKVRFFDLEGNEHTVESDGLLGRCFQHEIDHLDGKTLFESCAPMDRIKALKDYQIAIANGARPGDIE